MGRLPKTSIPSGKDEKKLPEFPNGSRVKPKFASVSLGRFVKKVKPIERRAEEDIGNPLDDDDDDDGGHDSIRPRSMTAVTYSYEIEVMLRIRKSYSQGSNTSHFPYHAQISAQNLLPLLQRCSLPILIHVTEDCRKSGEASNKVLLESLLSALRPFLKNKDPTDPLGPSGAASTSTVPRSGPGSGLGQPTLFQGRPYYIDGRRGIEG